MLLVLDVAFRLPDLTAHYADLGTLPRADFARLIPERSPLSIHFLSGSAGFALALFLLQLVFASLLIAGIRSQLAVAVSWFLMVSLQTRSPMILNAGDLLLRMLLFWAMFVPLGAAASIDRARRGLRESEASVVLSGGTIALLMQAAFVYLFNWLQKTGESWRDGSAVYRALGAEELTTRFGDFLRGFPAFLELATHAVFGFEILGAFLLFSPWASLRCLAVLGFCVLHLVYAASFRLGLFQWTCLVALLPFLPAEFWDSMSPRRVGRTLRALGSRIATWVRSRVPSSLDAALGRKPVRVEAPVAASALALVFLAYVSLWNLSTLRVLRTKESSVGITRVERQPLVTLEGPARWLGDVLRLDQDWGMFAPEPPLVNGWFVLAASLADGSRVDLARNGAPVSFEKPAHVADLFSSAHWQKYSDNLSETRFRGHWDAYGRYLCRCWNEAHPSKEAVEGFDVYFMRRVTSLTTGQPSQVRPVLIGHHDCEALRTVR